MPHSYTIGDPHNTRFCFNLKVNVNRSIWFIIKLQGLEDGTGGIDQRCRGTDLQMASTERCLQEGDGGGTDMTRAAAAVPTLAN